MDKNISNPHQQNDKSPGQGEGFYTIKVRGRLEAHWSEWLAELSITHDNQGDSILSGFIPDQAALHGVLVKIRDMGLILLSVEMLEKNNENEI